MTHTYYRYESGIWHLLNKWNYFAVPDENIRRGSLAYSYSEIALEKGFDSIPEYKIRQYFQNVGKCSVFSTFCNGTTDTTTKLVFGTECSSEFDAWRKHNNLIKGDPFTKIIITTDKPLTLVEDYLSDYVWTNGKGEYMTGIPIYTLQQQGTAYVVHPEDIVSIGIQHFKI